jgi:hypothetical protein
VGAAVTTEGVVVDGAEGPPQALSSNAIAEQTNLERAEKGGRRMWGAQAVYSIY